jgi:steroid delta-isomerase-like uncharacterized protein
MSRFSKIATATAGAAIVALATLAVSNGPASPRQAEASNAANESVVRSLFADVLNTGRVERADGLLAASFTLHDAPKGVPGNREGFKVLVGAFRAGFPDYVDTIDDVFSVDDRVVVRWTFNGTHTGNFLGVPASGKPATISGISIYRVENGKITDDWTKFDLMSLMQQIGAIPS